MVAGAQLQVANATSRFTSCSRDASTHVLTFAAPRHDQSFRHAQHRRPASPSPSPAAPSRAPRAACRRRWRIRSAVPAAIAEGRTSRPGQRPQRAHRDPALVAPAVVGELHVPDASARRRGRRGDQFRRPAAWETGQPPRAVSEIVGEPPLATTNAIAAIAHRGPAPASGISSRLVSRRRGGLLQALLRNASAQVRRCLHGPAAAARMAAPICSVSRSSLTWRPPFWARRWRRASRRRAGEGWRRVVTVASFDFQRLGRVAVAEAHDVDRDDHLAGRLGQLGDRLEQLVHLERRLRIHRGHGRDGLRVVLERDLGRAPPGAAQPAHVGVAKRSQEVADLVRRGAAIVAGTEPVHTPPGTQILGVVGISAHGPGEPGTADRRGARIWSGSSRLARANGRSTDTAPTVVAAVISRWGGRPSGLTLKGRRRAGILPPFVQ